jgi:hypothetical protein
VLLSGSLLTLLLVLLSGSLLTLLLLEVLLSGAL